MFENHPKPIVLGHRGSCARAPENTIPAFQLALQQGADGVELDVKLSADGQVVVIHDASVDRTTGGHGKVSALSLSELQSLDAGAFKGEQFRGTRIPTLEQVFEAIGSRGIINVELTNYATPGDRLVENVCGLVKRHAMENRILFSSFLGINLRKAQLWLPQVPRGLLALPGWKGSWARSFGFMFGDFQALHPHISDISPQQIWRVHRLTRQVVVWTSNTGEEAARLANWGVDGIITDDPGAILPALGRQA